MNSKPKITDKNVDESIEDMIKTKAKIRNSFLKRKNREEGGIIISGLNLILKYSKSAEVIALLSYDLGASLGKPLSK